MADPTMPKSFRGDEKRTTDTLLFEGFVLNRNGFNLRSCQRISFVRSPCYYQAEEEWVVIQDLKAK